MDMIFHTADKDGRAIQPLGNLAEMTVQGSTESGITEPRATVLGGEHQKQINGGEGLWHGWLGLGATPLGLCRGAAGYPG